MNIHKFIKFIKYVQFIRINGINLPLKLLYRYSLKRTCKVLKFFSLLKKVPMI